MALAEAREYTDSHPWLTYNLDLSRAPYHLWLMLGEARSKSEHVRRSLLRPEVAEELLKIFLIKGAVATTAIEGNTLSEQEAREVIDGDRELPPSKRYLGQEVKNIISACNLIRDAVIPERDEDDAGDRGDLSVSLIRDYNRLVLQDLEHEDGVVPGELRSHSVVVGNYRGAPARDCEYLLERMCEWLNSADFEPPDGDLEEDLRWPLAILKAIIAHLYIAWIHPFGDGNGRTARLLEMHILMAEGFPQPACQLLSNHYNRTRSEYYRQLGLASKNQDPMGFVVYAARGFVDELRSQLHRIWSMQYLDRWEQYVYQVFGELRTDTDHRRLRLIKDLSRESIQDNGKPLPDLVPKQRNELRRLSADLATMYATKTDRTLSRDINALVEMNLIFRSGQFYFPNSDVVLGFMPLHRGDRGPALYPDVN